jgi:hypothetical protein
MLPIRICERERPKKCPPAVSTTMVNAIRCPDSDGPKPPYAADAAPPPTCLFAVICKCLDHAAFGNPTARTISDHAFQFGLQRQQNVDPSFNFAELGARNCIDRLA